MNLFAVLYVRQWNTLAFYLVACDFINVIRPFIELSEESIKSWQEAVD